MKHQLLLFVFFLFGTTLTAQVNPENITIARDQWGVPHIYTKTDAEAAYGIAWVQAEDNFKIIQTSLMLAREILGESLGKEGAAADFYAGLLGMDHLVDSLITKDVSPEFMTYLEGFCQGVNDYGAKHSDELLNPNLLPVKPADILASYPIKIADFIGLSKIVKQVVKGEKWDEEAQKINFVEKGSNAFAFKKKMTKNDRTYLVGNPHVALEGQEGFYEIQVTSEEGMNFHGALFPGAVGPQLGTNQNLGWSHTNNYYDYTDVYLLKMHPTKKDYYEFDGEWLPLEKEELKLKAKIKGLPFTPKAKRMVYRSKYGPTLKSKNGNYFSFRMSTILGIRAAEQWYKMIKANNLAEFEEALKFDGLPYFNITYADKEDNVFYLFNGLIPERNDGYDWLNLLPGNTSETLWTDYIPFDERPRITNPDCGFVYNVNHNPFKCTCKESWLNAADFDKNASYDKVIDDLPRSLRFREIYKDGTPLSMEELKAIKYDITLPYDHPATAALRQLKDEKIPEKYQSIVKHLTEWDYKATPESPAPTLVVLFYEGLKQNDWDLRKETAKVPSEKIPLALAFVAKHMKKHFGTIEVPYKNFAVFKRKKGKNNKVLPVYGMRGNLGARWGEFSKKDGKFYATGGDTYMFFAQYDESGLVELETIVPYGNVNIPGDKHFDDQMELYATMKAKKMTFNKEEVMKNAERIYSPK